MKLYPRAALFLWLALAAASAWWIARHAVFTSDLTAFLPASSGRAERLLIAQLSAGGASRTLLVAIEGGEPARLARSSRELARSLAADPRFEYVTNGAAEYLRPALEFAFKHRYLLSPAIDGDRFSEESLRQALRENLDRAASFAGLAFRATLARDPTGDLMRIAEGAGQAAPASRHGVWFSADGKRALLLAQTAASGTDAVRQQETLDAMAAAFARIRADPGHKLLASGPGALAARARAAIHQDLRWLTGIASALVVLILVFVYRSPAAVVLSAVPVLTGLLVGVAAVSLVFGSVHGITLVFGITLIGEAVDYPSYVFTQRRAGESTADVLERVWPTLRLAVLTTVFGSLTLLLSSLQGLAQLGLLSMAGVFVAGLATRWVLPSLAPGRSAPLPRKPPFSLVRTGLALRGASWAFWVLFAAALAFLLWRSGGIWDDDLGRMSPLPESARELDGQLRADLRAPNVRFLLVASAASREEALARSERIAPYLRDWAADGVLEGFDLAARYLPSGETQERRRAALPDPDTLRRSLARAQKGLPYRAEAFAPFLMDVETARRGPLLAPEDLRGTGLDLKVQSLLVSSEGEWMALILLQGVREEARLQRLARSLPADLHATLLDLKSESERLIGGYRGQTLAFAAVGALAIAVLLYGGLRDLRRTLRVLLPVYAAIAMTVALLVALGTGLSLFHLVSLLLVLGVGLNYALFFNQAEAGTESEGEASLALTVCFLTTIAAFGCLAASRVPVLSAIGLTVSIGCALSLANAMVVGRVERWHGAR